MKNVPTIETVYPEPNDDVPAVFYADSGCDHCNKPASEWSTGLAGIDREAGWACGDFNVCPDCMHECTFGEDALTGLLRRGTTFVHITWYWFVSPSGK